MKLVRFASCARHLQQYLDSALVTNVAPRSFKITKLSKTEAFKCGCGAYAKWYVRSEGDM